MKHRGAGGRSAAPGLMLSAALALAGCAGAAARTEPVAPAPAIHAHPTGEAVLAISGAAALEVVGLTGDEARHQLGSPGLLRRERWAEFWRYRLESCVLDLYLYQEAADRRRVLYAELRRGQHVARPDECDGSAPAADGQEI